MFSFTSIFFLFAGGVLVLLYIVERRLLLYWYEDMSEHSWFLWGMNFPYINHPDGIKEFVKHRSDMILFLGLIHMVVGVVLIPLSDLPVLLLVWGVSFVFLSLAIRSHLIGVSIEINRKYRTRSRPPKVCSRCGKEIWYPLAHEVCPRCGQELKNKANLKVSV